MKKGLLIFCSLFLLLVVPFCSAHAEAGYVSQSVFTLPPFARFYSLSSSGTATALTFVSFPSSNIDYIINYQSFSGSLGDADVAYCFNPTEQLVAGNIYSLTVVFRYQVAVASNFTNVTFGSTLTAAANRFASGAYNGTTYSLSVSAGEFFVTPSRTVTGLEDSVFTASLLYAIFEPDINAVSMCVPFSSAQVVLGYYLTNLGESNSAVLNQIQTMIEEQQTTNDILDDIYNADLDSDTTEDLDTSSIDGYNEVEGQLSDYMDEADLDDMDIVIDSDTSSFIWDTITDLFQSHTVIFSTVIALLSIWLIKFALAR